MSTGLLCLVKGRLRNMQPFASLGLVHKFISSMSLSWCFSMLFAVCCVLLHIWCFGLTNLKQEVFFSLFYILNRHRTLAEWATKFIPSNANSGQGTIVIIVFLVPIQTLPYLCGKSTDLIKCPAPGPPLLTLKQYSHYLMLVSWWSSF